MTLQPETWARIKAIFDSVVDLDAGGRAARLDTACAGDAVLRREVERLLESYDNADTFLEEPARVLVGEPVVEAEDLIGRTIGPYGIESRIGAGGMGEVYLARDEKLNRPVALKLLSRSLRHDEDRLRRFRQEAHSVSALNHPNILVIHDFGDWEGRPYMVTEYVEGQTLRRRLLGGPMPLAEVVEVALQVAQALDEAHTHGIVHRDVKPENVMLRPDGYVKVLDFGLAKLADPPVDAGRPRHRTSVGVVMGTPQYMSPEQARGLELDARSDVWSLGAMVYEMVTGSPPFGGATSMDLLAAILNAEPVPLELKAPHTPPALGRLVAKALSKNRLDRSASGAELATELGTIRIDLARDAHGPAAEAVAGPGFAVEGESTPRSRAAASTRLVVLPFRLLRPDPDTEFLAFSLADAISTTLSNVDALIVRSSLAAARFATAELDLHRLAEETAVDAVMTGTLLRAGAQLRVSAQLLAVPEGTIIWSDRIDVAVDDLIRIQDELCERIVDSLSVPLATRDPQVLRRDVPAGAKAYELYLRGNSHFYHPENWTIARDLFMACVAEDPRYAPAWARLGRCYRLTAKFRSATVAEMRDNLKRAEVAFRNAFEINPDLPLAHHLYTPLETDLGRSAEAMLRLVRRTRQRRADPELYAGLVHACRYCGLLDASLAAHDHARRLDPQIATSVAQTHWVRGEFERAIDGFGPHGFFIGLPYVSLGRDREALEAIEQVAALARDATTRSYQRILPLLITGRSEECRRLLDDLAPRNPDPESVFHIARAYARLGALDAGAAQFARAVDAGYCCAPGFGLDTWLDPLRPLPAFAAAMTRAEARHAQAARRFRDAGGERLLGLT